MQHGPGLPDDQRTGLKRVAGRKGEPRQPSPGRRPIQSADRGRNVLDRAYPRADGGGAGQSLAWSRIGQGPPRGIGRYFVGAAELEGFCVQEVSLGTSAAVEFARRQGATLPVNLVT